MRTAFAVAVIAAAGCQGTGDPVGHSEAEIIGGTADLEFAGVCAMDITRPPDEEGDPQDPINCACALVAPDIVVTAAACVYDNLAADTLADITVTFGASVSTGDDFGVVDAETWRYFDPDIPGRSDIAVVRLDGDAEALGYPLVPLNDQPLDDTVVGSTATIVGFGEQGDDMPDSYGQRYRVDTPVISVSNRGFSAGTDEATTCNGDGGAPVFLDLGDGQVLAGISARSTTCFRSATRTRVDRFLTDFVHAYIDRFHGNCPINGVCEETDCRSVDPDCDPCAWGNECTEDCPGRDWDCDLGSFVGEPCAIDGDCEENGSCIAAGDQPDFSYCTRACDEQEGCPSEPVPDSVMECSGAMQCEYVAPSPGAQGFPCVAPTDCSSGICEELICVEPCPDGACPDPYVCGPSTEQPGTDVCLGTRLSGGGGFCSAVGARGGGGSGGAPAALVLVFLAVVFGWRLGGSRAR